MKNLTLMAFLLMTIFVLSSCASHKDAGEREVANDRAQKKEQVHCEKLDPHGPDQYFEEYERCKGY